MADATAAAHPFARMLTGILTLGDVFSFMVHLHASVGLLAHVTMVGLTHASAEVRQQAAAAFSAFEGAGTFVGVPAELCSFGTTTLSPRKGCHKALTSEAQASPQVDVGDTPDSEIEHEGKSVKEPCFLEVFPVFVRSLLGCTPVSSLVSEVTARTGVPGHLFSFVVEGKVVAGEHTLNECGVSRDMTLCMVARLRGGANPPSQRGTASGGAGQWFCVACQLGGCYAVRTRLSVWTISAGE